MRDLGIIRKGEYKEREKEKVNGETKEKQKWMKRRKGIY
jgi:hypothetical protein